MGIFLLLLKQAWPLWLGSMALGFYVRRQDRRVRPALAAWKAKRRKLEARQIEASHKQDNMDEMLEVQGALEAHELKRPRVPFWMFWA